MNNRAYALDALRGYAIITMVLSATIVTQVLPGWMSHAQTPPPDHIFNPSLPGITWVDLVFPFFLFAMGAAFPFSIGKRAEKGDSKLKLIYEAVKRGVQLTFFAIFIQHFYPYVLSSPQDIRAWLLAILCFAVLFPMFMRIPLKMPDWAHTGIKIAAYGIAVIMMLTTSYADGRTFSLYFSNVIILLLANMAISLIMHKRITTTLAKAKALKKYVEPLITKSKDDTTNSRRVVFSYLQNKYAVTELFKEISVKVADRPGGYTRIIKTGFRQGDNAAMCFIELVDYDENMAKQATKKTRTRRSKKSAAKAEEAPAAEAPAAETATETPASAE